MKTSTLLCGLIGGSVGVALTSGRKNVARLGTGAVAGAAAGVVVDAIAQMPGRVAKLESLMPKAQILSTYSQVVKPTPSSLFTDRAAARISRLGSRRSMVT